VTGLLGWLARRLALAALTLLAVAFVTYGMLRVLRPDRFAGTSVISGTVDDLERGFLHFDWGVACGWPGCPPIRGMFEQGFAADLWLIAGALVLGVAAGLLGAMWCARRPRTRRARAVEAVASALYCTPVYVLGLSVLLLFNPVFGLVPIPAFFDAEMAWAQPWENPWVWFTTLLVPWFVLAAPLAAMCLRLALAVLREGVEADHVRTAYAKGVAPRRVMSRHVAPSAYTETASFVGVSIPLIVINLILVERVFSVPGFFTNTYQAIGHAEGHAFNRRAAGPPIDYAMVQAISVWAALLIVLLGIAVDLVLVRLDPRIRQAGLPG
jgi:peptide/nickel transport system permease protein